VKAVIIALLLVGCSPATVRSGLHRAAQVTEWAAQGSVLCDAGSTHEALLHSDRYYETNYVMGSHPDGSVQAAYWTGIVGGIAIYNRVLPDILRVAANTIVIGIEYDAVSSNTSLGVKTCGI